MLVWGSSDLAFCFVPCDFCLELPQAMLVTRKEGKAHSSSSDGRGHAGNRSTDDSASNRKAAEDSREQPLVALSGSRGGRVMTERTRIEKVEFYKDLKTRTPGLVAG